ncbi:MAG: phospholipase [Actinomycetota bacterium]|nr:phospholipase [Actinomycetota bacterium]
MIEGTELLEHRVRPSRSEPRGALILFHGRGADENDLWPLLDMLDHDRRLVGATPRGPLALPPGGAHWYQVKRVGYPDPATFWPTFDRAGAWLDAYLSSVGIAPSNAVLGGFSQGAVMTYALGLGPGRPRPAGLLALSGFMPRVDDFDLDLNGLEGYPVAIGHGTLDPVIGVEWGRDARERLAGAGAAVAYRESPIPHTIDPEWMDECREWLLKVVP